uniref:Zinc finger and BTB domain containing 11 n=1 Tax=Latimeria chalumnae TaxID=7897 RepID=H3A2D0_LATCH
MSCEESYLAITRYLTNELEPYAPGTEANAKRKIRKAAACYVVRDGILYFQRRQRDRERFAELEVVLQADRRRRLIQEAHTAPDGGHHTRHQTWHIISQKYWWRGILKQVKDYIKKCSKCQEKVDRSLSDPSEVLEELGIEVGSFGENHETDEESSNPDPPAASASKTVKKKPISKHELVFVDSRGLVKQFSAKHGQAVLDQLNLQRLSNQFCDVTLLIEGEEYKAHKSILAANSEYFRELFIEKGAVASHEAVVDLSGFSKASFLPLLEFAYTSVLTFDFCNMAEVALLARHLYMTEVLEICEHVHRQVEEKKLTVYQKGGVHTIHTAENAAGEKEGGVIVTEGSEKAPAIELPMETNECSEVGTEAAGSQTTEPSREEPDSPLQSTAETASDAVGDGTTPAEGAVSSETVESDLKNAVPAEVNGSSAVEEMDTTPVGGEGGQAGDNVNSEALAGSETSKRKRGRPAKEDDPAAVSDNASTLNSDDTYKSRLRQRSLGEGGYIRLHKGTERKLQTRKANPKSAVQQVAAKLVQKGKKLRQPKRTAVENEVETEHKCKECGMVFQKRCALIMHKLIHERSKDYKCPLCEKEFQYAASLRGHLVRHKRRNETTSATASVQEPGAESVKGRTKREFICDICGKTLPKLYTLRIHMLRHTGVKPHACKVEVGKRSFIMHQFVQKIQVFIGHHLLFACSKSIYTFLLPRQTQNWMDELLGESKYLCPSCGKSFHRASGLSKHLKRHQPKPEVRGFQCAHCEKSFYEARELQQHMNKHLGVKPFQCQTCGKCYSWKKDWYSHVKSHSVTEPYRCNVCGKEFYEKALYRRHEKKATHGKKGRAKQNLERTCEHCGRKFTQLREYRRHMNNHEGVKPFECLTCGVAWADARSLKRHVRTHTGERPYVCPVCNEAYIDARTLRKHMTKFHKDYVPGKIMLEKDTLQFHNQGTQVEHAVSILTSEMQEQETDVIGEEIETVLVSGETLEALEAVAATEECSAVSSLTDQGIMQVVNYVLAQQQGLKIAEVTEAIETVEVEVAHVQEIE